MIRLPIVANFANKTGTLIFKTIFARRTIGDIIFFFTLEGLSQIVIELAQGLVRDTISTIIHHFDSDSMGWLFRDCHPIASTRKCGPHIHGFPGELEHFLAYGAVGSAYALAYCTTLARVVSGLILTGGAALLEGLQSFVPDRTPELADILASSSALGSDLDSHSLLPLLISRQARR